MSDRNFRDDSIQFPRLIAEMEAAGFFTKKKVAELCESMDLDERDVMQVVDRAQARWDGIKARMVRKGA